MNYPKLKSFLIVKFKKGVIHRKKNYRQMVFSNFFRIYYIITNKKINNFSLNYNNFFSFSYQNSKFYNNKLVDLNIFKFINIINPIVYFKLIKIFKKVFIIYVTFISHDIYHYYFLLSKNLRKVKFRHIISLHYKYENIRYKYISFVYKYY